MLSAITVRKYSESLDLFPACNDDDDDDVVVVVVVVIVTDVAVVVRVYSSLRFLMVLLKLNCKNDKVTFCLLICVITSGWNFQHEVTATNCEGVGAVIVRNHHRVVNFPEI